MNYFSLTAVKSKSVVTLSVDSVFTQPGIGDHRSVSTDTGSPLFLGGHRLIQRSRGIKTRTPYVGCIKNVQINNDDVQIVDSMKEGGVTIGSCPKN